MTVRHRICTQKSVEVGPTGFLWRMVVGVPQKLWFLWRTTRHAPLKVQRSINSDNRVWGPSYYCGAQMVVRHKRHHFCGAQKTHAPQTSVAHYYLCATKILLWRMAYLVRHKKWIHRKAVLYWCHDALATKAVEAYLSVRFRTLYTCRIRYLLVTLGLAPI